MNVDELRQTYPEFVFRSATWKTNDDQLVAEFVYSANNHQFLHTIHIPTQQNRINSLDVELIQKLVFSLGMVELLSYWKAFCSPVIKVEAGVLTSEQKKWWQNLLIEGMGEYFFVNQIDFTVPNFVNIVAGEESAQSTIGEADQRKDANQSFLIPVGGGKDSVVTIELLKQYRDKTGNEEKQENEKKLESENVGLTTLVVNPTQAATDVVVQSGLPVIRVLRNLDPHLFELNSQGYLNGHVPFSASLAFISVLTSYLHNIGNVVLSNEASANEASLTYLGRSINHQYSKSFAFETDFRWYIKSLLPFENLRVTPQSHGEVLEPDSAEPIFREPQDDSSKNVVVRHSNHESSNTLREPQGDTSFENLKMTMPNYFSLLRPLNELQIGRLFAQYGQSYFATFRSCNRGNKTNVWCGDCPKCLFSYLMLAPWLDESTMINIFGQNLLERADLLPVLRALIGVTPDKPLECVGLRQESLVAYHLTLQRCNQTGQPLPKLISSILSTLQAKEDLSQLARTLLSSWNPHHFLPADLEIHLHQQN